MNSSQIILKLAYKGMQSEYPGLLLPDVSEQDPLRQMRLAMHHAPCYSGEAELAIRCWLELWAKS